MAGETRPFDFDPFPVDDEHDTRTSSSSAISQTSTTKNTRRTKSPTLHSVGSTPLPPRLNVRLSLHEEVSVVAIADPDCDGSGSLSQLSIEGTIAARIDSSNAKENTPFALHISGTMASMADFACLGDHSVLVQQEEDINSFVKGAVRCRVDIPKAKVTGCDILRYHLTTQTQNMAILVQSRAVIANSVTYRISVQIRSNLSNVGDLAGLLVVVAVPSTLRDQGVRVTRGDQGQWDAHKRLLTWKIGPLPHGESRLVSAEAEISEEVAALLHENPFDHQKVADKIRCPILVRCTSAGDQMSDLTLTASALERVPATIVQQQVSSYRLLHRVPGKDRA